MSMEKENRVTIVELTPPQNINSGDYFYRTTNPFSELAKLDGIANVISISSFHPNALYLMANADIVVINQVCDPDILPILYHRKVNGLPTIYEVQDNIEYLQRWNPAYYFYKNKDNQNLIRTLISESTALQANNHYLLNQYADLNSTIKVFENNLPKIDESCKKQIRDALRIGWGGSHGHLEDIRNIAPVLSNWINEIEDVELWIMGSDDIFNLFRSISSDKKVHVKPGTIFDYYKFLDRIDVGLAPLLDTPYNRSRSDVKYIEYAGHQVIPVMQKLTPYTNIIKKGENGFLFDSDIELISILDKIINDPALVTNVLKNAFGYVSTKRLEYQNSRKRLDFYLSLGDKKYNGTLSNLNTQVPAAISEFEALLYRGTVAMELNGNPSEAINLFSEALTIQPDSYLANIMISRVQDTFQEQFRFLEKAIQLNRYSLRAKVFAGDLCAKKGMVKRAMHFYQDALKVNRYWEKPYVKLAELMNAEGFQKHAKQMKEAIPKLPSPGKSANRNSILTMK